MNCSANPAPIEAKFFSTIQLQLSKNSFIILAFISN